MSDATPPISMTHKKNHVRTRVYVALAMLGLCGVAYWAWPVSQVLPTAVSPAPQRATRNLDVTTPVDAASAPVAEPEQAPLPDDIGQVYSAMAPYMDIGYVSCTFPIRVENSTLSLVYPEWHGNTVTGFVREPEGVGLASISVPSPVEGERPSSEPVGVYRWWDAEKGQRGSCEVEPPAEVLVRGVLLDDQGPMAGHEVKVCGSRVVTDGAGRFTLKTWRRMFCLVGVRGGVISIVGKPLDVTSFHTSPDDAVFDVELFWSPEPPARTPEEKIDRLRRFHDRLVEPDAYPAELALQVPELTDGARVTLNRFLGENREAAAGRAEYREILEMQIEDELIRIEAEGED